MIFMEGQGHIYMRNAPIEVAMCVLERRAFHHMIEMLRSCKIFPLK